MRISKRSAALTGCIATLAAALVLLAVTDDAIAGSQARTSWGTSSRHSQNTIHQTIAKSDHGHRHHRREFRLGRLVDRPVYCDCSYESCPEWVIVQCALDPPRHLIVRRAKRDPMATILVPLLSDPNYD